MHLLEFQPNLISFELKYNHASCCCLNSNSIWTTFSIIFWMVHKPGCWSCELTAALFRTAQPCRAWMENNGCYPNVMENRQGRRTSSGPPNWQRWAPAHTNTGMEPSAEAERGTYRLHLADKWAQTNPASAETHVPLQAVRRQRWVQTPPVVLSLCARLHLPAKLSLLCRHPHNGGRGGIKRKWHAGWHLLCEEMSLQAWGLQVLSDAQGWWLTLTIAYHVHVSGSVCSCPLKNFKAWPLQRMR